MGRLRGGPVAWQLATRRLQLNSSASARMVSGIDGRRRRRDRPADAVQRRQGDFVRDTGADTARAQVLIATSTTSSDQTARDMRQLAGTKGVREVIGYLQSQATQPDAAANGSGVSDSAYLPVDVGDCASLRELAAIGADCKPGSTFLVPPTADMGSEASLPYLKPGHKVDLNVSYGDHYSGTPRLWTIPADTRTVGSRVDPSGSQEWGILATPEAIDSSKLFDARSEIMVGLDDRQPDAVEYVRNTAAAFGVTTYARSISDTATKTSYTQLRRGLFAGATLTMVLIGASLLVSMLEQLRDRKKLLAVLVAFGTKRSALAWSVLWQTTIPVVLGLVLACVGGVGLGAALLAMVGRPFEMDWGGMAMMTAIGSAVILAVTLLSLPPLWRLMRPDGLHDGVAPLRGAGNCGLSPPPRHRPVVRHGPNSPFRPVTTRAPGGGWSRSSPRPWGSRPRHRYDTGPRDADRVTDAGAGARPRGASRRSDTAPRPWRAPSYAGSGAGSESEVDGSGAGSGSAVEAGLAGAAGSGPGRGARVPWTSRGESPQVADHRVADRDQRDGDHRSADSRDERAGRDGQDHRRAGGPGPLGRG